MSSELYCCLFTDKNKKIYKLKKNISLIIFPLYKNSGWNTLNTAIFVNTENYFFFFYLFAIGPNDVMGKIMQ